MGKDYRSRKGSDIVYTPYSMTKQLLEKEKFNCKKNILEPASGNLTEGILPVFHVLSDYGFLPIHGDITNGFNFLTNQKVQKYHYIITNPPFSLWDKFIERSREIASNKFAFLGQTNFLNGVSRFNNKLYYPGSYNLKKFYVFTRQANLKFFDHEEEIKKLNLGVLGEEVYIKKYDKIKKQIEYTEIRKDGKYPAGAVVYAWYVFEKGYTGKAQIDFINNQDYILKKGE